MKCFRVLLVAGTRPEAIKLAPVYKALQQDARFKVRLCVTAQHRALLDQVLEFFQIRPDIDLDVMQPGQTLHRLTGRLVAEVGDLLVRDQPEFVLVQGDTTTVAATALACFYNKIPFGHVEAGLRTGNILDPFPEEANRVMASLFASLHFAPTEESRNNLLAAGVPASQILVTGNTVVDALLEAVSRAPPLDISPALKERLVLVTTHRRENFGTPLRNICIAVRNLANAHSETSFLMPIHPNPNIRDTVEQHLAGLHNVILSPPLAYGTFVAAMVRSSLILTDSGGVQEEAPALGKPVLVLRNETERPESVKAGGTRVVGTDAAAIFREADSLLSDDQLLNKLRPQYSPYGDGTASKQIVRALLAYFESSERLPN